jgi:O-antigen/teichoic acid export membrane protein
VIEQRSKPQGNSRRRPSRQGSDARSVLRNTFFLGGAQIVGVPLSILTNAVTARYLGPTAFGYLYVGTTFNSFASLAVDWGQAGAIPAFVARDRARAGEVLGTSFVWRGMMSVVAYLVLAGLCRLLNYPGELQTSVSLVFIGYALSTFTNGSQWVILGFERADLTAYRQVLEQFATVAIVVPILLVGGTLNVALVGHAVAALLALLYTGYVLRGLQLNRVTYSLQTLKALLRLGTPFMFTGFAMSLQPSIDAAFLSTLAPADVVGWHSAARRLIGFLVFPVASLVGALYPTLCRLHGTDSEAFTQMTKSAVRAATLLAIPTALGCLLYPDIGVALFDSRSFSPTADNLRMLSPFLFLLFFTMPLGTCIAAAGKQRSWAIVQSVCVATSVVLDPILIPLYEQRTGNGGLGVSVATVVSEILVAVGAIVLAPRDLFAHGFWRSLVPGALAGAAMVLVAYSLRQTTSFVAAPLALTVYAGCLWLTGGVDRSVLVPVRDLLGRRSSRVE